MKRWISLAVILVVGWASIGCATFPGFRDPEVYLVNVVPVGSTPFEQRVRVDLRLRNPDHRDCTFAGLDFVLELNGEPMLRGYASEGGTLPAYGELVVSTEASSSVIDLVRQFSALSDSERRRSGVDLYGRLHVDGIFQRTVYFESPY